ncbi:MAG: hypothetical protein V4717_23995 [Bacteroidota bacterium]
MKVLLLWMLLTGCMSISKYSQFYDTRHSIIQLDSVEYGGKVIYRIFSCSNNCGYRDTFPNPAINNTVKAYHKLLMRKQYHTHARH